jgi:hypothetical protein
MSPLYLFLRSPSSIRRSTRRPRPSLRSRSCVISSRCSVGRSSAPSTGPPRGRGWIVARRGFSRSMWNPCPGSHLVVLPEVRRGWRSCCEWRGLVCLGGVAAVEQVVQVGAGELPVEGLGDGVVAGLECGQAVADLLEVGEVVRGEDLALDDGEVDLGPGLARRRARAGGSGARWARLGASDRPRHGGSVALVEHRRW